jgi:anti-anti-sigma factor
VSSDGDPGTLVVALSGEVDLAAVDAMRSEIFPHLDGVVVDVVLDLAGVEFLDSSGITLLLEIGRKAHHLTLRDASAPARLVIDATGLADWFPAET